MTSPLPVVFTRLLVRRVNHHLYYQLVESPTRTIQVVAFWHASRGNAPGL